MGALGALRAIGRTLFLWAPLLLAACSPSEPPAGTEPRLGPTPQRSAAEAPLFAAWVQYERATTPQDAERPTRYIDAELGHQVFQLPPQGLPLSRARALLLDDDKVLLSTGKKLWAAELVFEPGFTGRICFLHSFFCFRELFQTRFAVDGVPRPISDEQFAIVRFPSHTRIRYTLPPVVIDEYKFITEDDRAVALYEVRSSDQKAHTVTLDAVVSYLPLPNPVGQARVPLLGSGSFQQVPIFAYLDAPGFGLSDGAQVRLTRQLQVPASGEAVRAQVAVSFESEERKGSASLPPDLFERHVRSWHQWFADHVPYFDCSDPGFKRMWYYRWWLVRFNMTEANTPELSGYRFYEGKLGFDNAITFALPVQIKELTYLRDPKFALSQVHNAYRNLAPNGALVDPPGSPYWGETYSHWTALAVWEFHLVHPFPLATLRQLLPSMARDVRAWVTSFDADSDGLPQSARPRITGYDLDILSYWFFHGLRVDPHTEPPDLERVDFASFVYANARALALLAAQAGDPATEREFAAVAEKVRAAALQSLWDEATHFFYPQRAEDNARIPIRELHGFFPFLTGLAPDEPRYTRALEFFVDPQEFWARFPPVITSQYHYQRWTWEMDGLTRNIAPHPISMGARVALQAIRHYHHHPITPAHFMEILERYNQLVYPGVHPYDPYWRPNVHEYYSKWEPYQISSRPKPSDISHDFHSMFNSLVVEGAIGLQPRADDWLELRPLATTWSRFLLDRLRYRGHDLTIVWDQPDGQRAYPQFEEGFSVLADGKRLFHGPELRHVVVHLQTGELRDPS